MSDVTLTREGLALDEVQNQHVWPLKVTAVSAISGLPSKMFVYHAAMDDDDYEGDIFECVASVQQLTEVPEDAPAIVDELDQVPYYRLDELLFHCRTPEEAEDLWEKVQEEVDNLVRNFNAMNNLADQEEVTLDGS